MVLVCPKCAGLPYIKIRENIVFYQVRVWREGTVIKSAEDYNAKRENDLKIYGLNPEIKYKLRVFGFSRGGDGTMSSPAVEFKLGKPDF